MDVPQDQAQIRQNNGCSTARSNPMARKQLQHYRCYLGYGQVVTANSPKDQQAALANLDQVPYSTGTGRGTQLSPKLDIGQGTCTSALTIAGTTTCPNNAANFGSVTGTIGGARAFTMGFHITY